MVLNKYDNMLNMLTKKLKIIVSSVVSALFVFCAFHFNPRNIAILASRSLERQIFAYILNFVIFFVVVYLVLSLFNFLAKKFFGPKQ